MKATSRDRRSSFETRTGLVQPGPYESRCQLRAAVEGIGSLAGLGLNVFGNNREPLGLRKSRHGCALGLYTEARAALSVSRDPNARNRTACVYFRNTRHIPPFALRMEAKHCNVIACCSRAVFSRAISLRARSLVRLSSRKRAAR